MNKGRLIVFFLLVVSKLFANKVFIYVTTIIHGHFYGGGKGLYLWLDYAFVYIFIWVAVTNWSGIVEYSVENKYKRRLIILLFLLLLRRRLPYCYATNALFTHITTIRHVQSPSPPSS
jgi:hypothetical protein